MCVPLLGPSHRGLSGSPGQQKQNGSGSPGVQISRSSCFRTTPRPPFIINAPHYPYQSALARAAMGGGSIRGRNVSNQVLVLESPQPTVQTPLWQLLTLAAPATASNGTRKSSLVGGARDLAGNAIWICACKKPQRTL